MLATKIRGSACRARRRRRSAPGQRGPRERNWFRGTAPCSGFDNPQSAPASPFWPQDFRRRLCEDCRCPRHGRLGDPPKPDEVILPSLMIGIDQSIVAERRQTFGAAVDGPLRPKELAAPAVRFETEPGEQMQVDWAVIRRGDNRL